MTVARRFLFLIAVVVLPALAGCSSSASTTPRPVMQLTTYYTTFNGTALSAQIGVLPHPLLSTSSLVATVSNTASNGVLSSGQMLFDSSGRLWVVNNSTNPRTIVVFTSLPLTATSTPAFTLTLPAAYSGTTYGIAFDSAGNLWASSTAAPGVVDEFNGPFTASATLTANIALTTTGCGRPEGLAFDASGNLWVACESSTGTNSIAEYLKGTGFTNLTPIDHYLAGLMHPVGLIFDRAGNLASGSHTTAPNNGVALYLSSNLASGATPNVYDSTGLGTSPFPYQFVIDSTGNLYEADCGSTLGVYVFPTGSSPLTATLAPTTTYSDTNITGSGCVGGVAVQ